MHSLSSNLFSRWCSRFQQQICAQIRIQKKPENNTQPGGLFFFFFNRHHELPGVVKKPSRVSAVWRSLPPPPCLQPARPAPWRPRALGQVSKTALLPPRCLPAAPLLAPGGFGNRRGGGGGGKRDRRELPGQTPGSPRTQPATICQQSLICTGCSSGSRPPRGIFLSAQTISPDILIYLNST